MPTWTVYSLHFVRVLITIETSGVLGPQSHHAVHQGPELLHPASDQRANLMHTSISHPEITFTCAIYSGGMHLPSLDQWCWQWDARASGTAFMLGLLYSYTR